MDWHFTKKMSSPPPFNTRTLSSQKKLDSALEDLGKIQIHNLQRKQIWQNDFPIWLSVGGGGIELGRVAVNAFSFCMDFDHSIWSKSYTT